MVPEVVRTLVRHGLAPAAAAATAAAGAELRARTAQEGREFAAMLDADSGETVGAVLAGWAAEVVIEDHLQRLAPGHRYVQLHTHPGSSAFSLRDAILLAAIPAIRTMAVVGVDGTWYALSKGRGAAPAPERVRERYLATREARALRRQYRDLRGAGMGEREAAGVLAHEVWQRAAPQLGLRYARLR